MTVVSLRASTTSSRYTMPPCFTPSVNGPSAQTVSCPFKKIAADKIRCRQIFMTGHGDQTDVPA